MSSVGLASSRIYRDYINLVKVQNEVAQFVYLYASRTKV